MPVAKEEDEGAEYESPWTRLLVLEKSQDGFYISEQDLKLRGPGDFFGTKQSGSPTFQLADLARDARLLEQARKEAQKVYALDPGLHFPEHRALRKYFFAILDGSKHPQERIINQPILINEQNLGAAIKHVKYAIVHHSPGYHAWGSEPSLMSSGKIGLPSAASISFLRRRYAWPRAPALLADFNASYSFIHFWNCSWICLWDAKIIRPWNSSPHPPEILDHHEFLCRM